MTTWQRTRKDDRLQPRAQNSSGRPGRSRGRRARPFRLTDRDLELLAFVAAHRFVLAAQVRRWIEASCTVAYRRLFGLVEVGLISYERIFHAEPGCYRITNGGLAVIDSELPRPSVDLRTYGHDIGVVWMWLAARTGYFGRVQRLLSEREMRSHDQRGATQTKARFGVPVPGYDRHGRPRIHYPDVLVVAPDAATVALELELTLKGRRRLQDILIGYAGAPAMRRVVYLVGNRAVGRSLRCIVQEVGVGELVEIRALPGNGHDYARLAHPVGEEPTR